MKHKSINFKILLPLCLTVVIESLTLCLLFLFITKPRLDSGLINNFKSDVETRTDYLETAMSTKWSNLDSYSETIIKKFDTYMQTNNLSEETVLGNKEYSDDVLLEAATTIPKILSNNAVTNVYVILNNSSYDAIFLSTKNPNKVLTRETIVDFAPQSVVKYYYSKEYNISKDAYSKTVSSLSSKDFFQTPINTYEANSVSAKLCSYWSNDLVLSKSTILTYTRPLVVNDTVIGVLGVGVSSTYLETYMNSISKNSDINISLIRKTNNTMETVFTAYKDYSLPLISNITLKDTKFDDISSFEAGDEALYVYLDTINFKNSIYEDGEYVLVGICPSSTILSTSNSTTFSIFIIILIVTVISVGLIHIFTLHLSKPIKNVASQINENNITSIPKTRVLEVDTLIDKLEYYFNSSLEFDQKLNRIIEDSNAKIAVAEYFKDTDYITTTINFYSILGLPYENNNTLKDEFISRILELKDNVISSNYDFNQIGENLFESPSEFIIYVDNHYIRFKSKLAPKGVIITLIDLTKEYEARLEIEHERDYDVLTKIYNRRGFKAYVQNAFKTYSNLSLYMIDVDNLKKINDAYGHECGDEYIKYVGNYLYDMSLKFDNLVPAHLSGDEFVILLLTNDTEIVNNVSNELMNLQNHYIEFSNSKIHISLSCGVALRENNVDYSELKKRADFAMYQSKTHGKNLITYFDINAYELYKHEDVMLDDLNSIIENNLVDYAYQPIVDLKTAEIYSYEALMRPKLENFKSPQVLIEYARKYNKLYDIELITIFDACSKFLKSGSNKYLFINSIASQVFKDSDFERFAKDNSAILDRIVVEIIEEDFGQDSIIDKKIKSITNLNVNYAIDDYGTGYNNLRMLLEYTPKFIKLEGSLIRGIDKDLKKLQFTRAIVDFCKTNNILVIAESVETVQELQCVKDIGCDYVQGYLIAKPCLEIKEISDEAKALIKNLK